MTQENLVGRCQNLQVYQSNSKCRVHSYYIHKNTNCSGGVVWICVRQTVWGSRHLMDTGVRLVLSNVIVVGVGTQRSTTTPTK